MKDFKQLLDESIDLFNIPIDVEKYQQLKAFADHMALSNRQYNLSGIKDPVDIRKKHFLDSISCLPMIEGLKNDKAIDVGTGAGFPGVVIKILHPEIDVTLVDSVGKKTTFLGEVKEQLGLEKLNIINGRAEALGQDPEHREKYDLVFARALAKMPVMLEYLLPLTAIGGYVIAQRGSDSKQEAEGFNLLIKRLGGEVEEITPVEIPDMTERYIIKIRKISETSVKYPRRVGVPKKNPMQNI